MIAIKGLPNSGGGGGGGTPGGSPNSVQYNNAGSFGGVLGNVTGQLLAAQNGSAPSFSSPGLPTSVITATGTLTLCDTSTALTGRGSTFLLQPTGAITVTIPDPATSGCGSNIAFQLSNESSQTVTVSRGTSATFNVINGTSLTSAATTFNLTTGQSAVVNSDNTNWHVVISGGGSGGSGTVGSAEVVAFSATPTFSTAFNVSRIVLTGNITSFTMSGAVDGQSKTLCFKQGAGPFTVLPPAIVHGFFTVGTTNADWNCQSFVWDNTDSIWQATGPGAINQ